MLKHSCWAGMEEAVKIMATPALSQVDWVDGERGMVRLPLPRLLSLEGRKLSRLWEGAYFVCAAGSHLCGYCSSWFAGHQYVVESA
jgi:hypothetical protein